MFTWRSLINKVRARGGRKSTIQEAGRTLQDHTLRNAYSSRSDARLEWAGHMMRRGDDRWTEEILDEWRDEKRRTTARIIHDMSYARPQLRSWFHVTNQKMWIRITLDRHHFIVYMDKGSRGWRVKSSDKDIQKSMCRQCFQMYCTEKRILPRITLIPGKTEKKNGIKAKGENENLDGMDVWLFLA